MPRLRRGGREALDQMDLDLEDAQRALAHARHWVDRREPIDAARALAELEEALWRLKRRLHEDVEPLLQRRDDGQPTLTDRVADLEERLAQMEAGALRLVRREG
jgi:septation ring formation regulator EzrA